MHGLLTVGIVAYQYTEYGFPFVDMVFHSFPLRYLWYFYLRYLHIIFGRVVLVAGPEGLNTCRCEAKRHREQVRVCRTAPYRGN